MARIPTSNVSSNLSPESLQVAFKRVGMLLNKHQDYTPTVLDTFGKMRIHSYHVLYVALSDTRDNKEVAEALRSDLKKQVMISFCEQLSFYRYALVYMDERWEYDHEYFQQTIER